MGRAAKVWQRKDRPGWWATIDGRQVCLGADHAEATRELHRLKARSAPPKSSATVAESIDRYLEAVKDQIAKATYEHYTHYLQSFVNHAGRVRATDLEARHVHGWLATHPKWCSSTRHTAVSVVRTWSRWALDPDPLSRVRRPKMTRRPPPAPGALDATLAAFLQPEMADFATVLLDTGCRPGEIRTLEAAAIDWERSTARVTGKRGERLVGLTARALEVLGRYAQRYPSGPVLRNAKGAPWTACAVMCQFRRAAIRAGQGRCVAYHARHAFWARATKAGVSDVAISKQLGHSNLRMLIEHYAEADHEIMRETARRAGRES